MKGGLGNDVYIVNEFGDTVIEGVSEGVDEIQTNLSLYFLDDGVENLTATAGVGQILIGNDLANMITGGAGNDILNGNGGADTLEGGNGDDLYGVDDLNDIVLELVGGGNDGIDTDLASYSIASMSEIEALTGISNSGQSLTGNSRNNYIEAGQGNDTIDGGAGADLLHGGTGNDAFRSTAADLNGDTIADFAAGDKIVITNARLEGFSLRCRARR